MKKLQNILVPIDFSNTSSLILAQGARLASWNNARLHVLHVVDQSSLHHFERTHGKQNRERIVTLAHKHLDECLEEVDLRRLSVEKAVEVGHPAHCIVQRTEKEAADLVILSAHDTGHKRLGRVASHVVRRASCKVLIARDWQPGPFRRIAACVDFSDLSAEVLDQAVQVASQDKASLEMIHVIYPVDRDYYVYQLDFGTKSADEYRAAAEEWVREKTEDFTAPFRDDLEQLDFTATTLESTDPAVAITSHLLSNQFDLVVLGTTGHESTFGLRFGSNAERLIRDTHCSVLAIKPKR